MRPLLRERGHRLFAPTYTGLGERAHLAAPTNDLETFIQDVVGVIETEELEDIVLIGHSFGGTVATGVADRARDRVAHLCYLDAFVPEDGQCHLDLVPEPRREEMRRAAQREGDGWLVPSAPPPDDTSPEDRRWILRHRRPQALASFESPLVLRNGPLTLPRSYIYCLRTPPGDPFGRFAERAREAGWAYFEIDASHSPHITASGELTDVLSAIAGTEGDPGSGAGARGVGRGAPAVPEPRTRPEGA